MNASGLGLIPAPLRSHIKPYLKRLAARIPTRLRYSRDFWHTYAFLEASQEWSASDLADYQLHILRRLLRHANAHVPYYSRLFADHGIDVGKITSLSDLKKIPTLEKSIVREQGIACVAENVPRSKLLLARTSGTSGRALKFWEEKSIKQQEWAFICHQWSRIGYKPGDYRAELRTYFDANKDFLWDHWRRALRLPPDLHHAKHVIGILENSGIEYVHGYPTAVASLALAIKRNGIRTSFRPKAALLASEIVYDWQRQIIEEVLQCRTFAHYGLTEKVVLASECEKSQEYHCIPQYGITEVEPETGEIIATGFLNFVNPFIRYRTGDRAVLSASEACPGCARSYAPRFAAVEGRLADTIRTPSGRLISPGALTYPFRDLTTIRDAQLRQKSENKIEIAVAKWPDRTDADLESESKQLAAAVARLVGEGVTITISHEPELGRSETGKFRWIISDVGKEYINEMMKR